MPMYTGEVLDFKKYFPKCSFEMVDTLILKEHCFSGWGSFLDVQS